MPRRFSKRKRSMSRGKGRVAKQRRRSSRRKGSGVVSVRSGIAPLPDRFITRLKFCERYALTTTSPVGSAGSALILRMTSIFQPEVGGSSTHQPFGRDQLAALYTKYIVTGVKYRVTFENTTIAAEAGGDYLIHCAVIKKNEPTLTGSTTTMGEKPRGQHGWIGGRRTQHNRWTARGYFKPAAVMGIKRSKYMSEDNFSADVVSNPVDNAFLVLQVAGTNAITANEVAGAVCIATVDLVYNVAFFERVALGGS